MPSVTVPVLKPLTYQGRSYVRGDMVAMRPIDAAAAARAGQVDLAKGAKPYQTREMTAEPPVTEPVRGRRRHTYKRRDMQAITDSSE